MIIVILFLYFVFCYWIQILLVLESSVDPKYQPSLTKIIFAPLVPIYKIMHFIFSIEDHKIACFFNRHDIVGDKEPVNGVLFGFCKHCGGRYREVTKTKKGWEVF